MNRIYIKESLSELEPVIGENSGIFVIIDNKLKQFYKYFDRFHLIELETSEKNKTLETVGMLTGELLVRGADRNAFVIGVGGGITTDMVGFTAAVYKRGVRFAFVPTTLLAQVDASIGGKNGVNFHSYKNMVGTITQPEWVYECTEVLKTLPPREFRAGVAEVLKTFILFDEAYYKTAVAYFAELDAFQKQNGTYCAGDQIYKQPVLTDIIHTCALYKCGVVERDAFEKGERRLLNLGHTFAHAIEKACGEFAGEEGKGGGIMHGEAVSVGLVLAAKLAGKMGRASTGFAEKLAADLKKTGLPVDVPEDAKTGSPIAMDVLVEALKKDKKVDGEYIHFILPERSGKAEDVKVPLKTLEELAGDLC